MQNPRAFPFQCLHQGSGQLQPGPPLGSSKRGWTSEWPHWTTGNNSGVAGEVPGRLGCNRVRGGGGALLQLEGLVVRLQELKLRHDLPVGIEAAVERLVRRLGCLHA